MTVRIVPLRSDEAGDHRVGGTPDERAAAVTELTMEVWRLARRPFPTYVRSDMPVVRATLMNHAGST